MHGEYWKSTRSWVFQPPYTSEKQRLQFLPYGIYPGAGIACETRKCREALFSTAGHCSKLSFERNGLFINLPYESLNAVQWQQNYNLCMPAMECLQTENGSRGSKAHIYRMAEQLHERVIIMSKANHCHWQSPSGVKGTQMLAPAPIMRCRYGYHKQVIFMCTRLLSKFLHSSIVLTRPWMVRKPPQWLE